MISNKREDYKTADDWLEALQDDEICVYPYKLFRSAKTEDELKALQEKALDLLGNGGTRAYWEIYNHLILSVVREMWYSDIPLYRLKIQTVGMLILTWTGDI